MNRLKVVLSRLDDELRPAAGESVLMIAPPLLRRRFTTHMLLGAMMERLTGKPREFPRLLPFQKRSLGKRWSEYRKKLVMPTLQVLLKIREHSAVQILPHVTFNRFRHALREQRYKLFFLVAHHVVRGDREWIELADGGIQLAEMEAFLQGTGRRDSPVALVLMVCTSSEIERAVYGRDTVRLSLGTYSWKLQMPVAIEVWSMYVQHLDGRRSLTDVHAKVVDQIRQKEVST